MTPNGQGQKKSRVIVVEDHPVVCNGLKQLIGGQPDLACTGVADNISDTKRLVEQCKPDLMLLDLRLKGRASRPKGARPFARRRVDLRRTHAPCRRLWLQHERKRHERGAASSAQSPGRRIIFQRKSRRSRSRAKPARKTWCLAPRSGAPVGSRAGGFSTH